MRTRTAALLASFLAAILLAGIAASGASAESPGLDQYVETIPGAGGNNATRDGDKDGNGGDSDNGGSDSSGSPAATGPAVDSSQLDALRSQGDAGQRAAAALEATSGGEKNDGSKADPDKAGHSDVEPLDLSEADGKAPVEAILSSMFGGGSGIVLPIIMLAVLVGGLVIAARTRAGSIND